MAGAGRHISLDALGGAGGQLFPWVPVVLAIGIGAYFKLPVEPRLVALALLALVCATLLVARLRADVRWHAPLLTAFLLTFGLVLAAARAHLVAAPVLPFRYYGPVEGRIVEIDRSFSDAIRITLDRVVLSDVDPAITPARVRLALHGDPVGTVPMPGARIMVTGHLAAPQGPVAPGGFDFQRIAWFARLGAVGYTHVPPVLVARPDSRSPGMLAFGARMVLSREMQGRMPGQAGALAAAFMTGDRSGVSEATNEVMRASNLSHMISISGLHMGLVVGFVFALVRYGLALVPPLGLRVNGKKVAAVAALGAATAYMLLAGPDVATRRAWIMAAVMLIAVLSDRRAISMRSLAIAAVTVLLLTPESLLNPGFQMSFGATAALIAIYAIWADHRERVPAILRPVILLVLSSAIAGLATGPIAAAHFNRIAGYGLIANLLAVPVMGVIVMPAGVMAAILSPLGLAAPAFWLMQKGTELILAIAVFVAGMDGAVAAVPSPGWYVLPVFALGGALAFLARGPLRLVGVAAVGASLALWPMSGRPDLLIAGDGALVGLMTDTGRAPSKAKGAGFVAENWLQDDGELIDQETAFARGAFTASKGRSDAVFDGRALIHLTGKTAGERALPLCTGNALIVIEGDWAGSGDCDVWDRRRLAATGAVAVSQTSKGPTITTARDVSGDRLWNRPTARPSLRQTPAGWTRRPINDRRGGAQ